MATRGRKKGSVNKTIEYVSLADLNVYGAVMVPVKSQFAAEVRAVINWKNGVVTESVEDDDADEVSTGESASNIDLEYDDFSDDED